MSGDLQSLSDAELLSLAQQHLGTTTPSAEPSIGQQAGRIAGLSGRALIRGGTYLPTLMADAMYLPVKAINDYRYPGTQGVFPSQALDTALTKAGLPEPQNFGERLGVNVGSALSGAGVTQAALNLMQPISRVGQGIKDLMMTQPARQGVAAGTGATSATVAGEMGAGPVGQTVAGLIGGALPFARQATFPTSPNRAPELDLIAKANQAGFRLPPGQMGSGITSRAVEGLAGKEALGQEMSIHNQSIVDKLARRALGISDETPLDTNTINAKKTSAGQVYEEIKNAGIGGTNHINLDYDFLKGIKNLGGRGYAELKKSFPNLAKGDIESLQQSLTSASPTTEGIIEATKELRFKASQNYRAVDSSGNPSQRGLAAAQKDAANLLEDLVERSLTRYGQGGLVDRFRQARRDYAVANSIEDAMDARGHVIGRNLDPKDPLSPELRLASDFTRNFSRANQNVDKMPSSTPFTKLDMLNAGIWGFGGSQIHPTYGYGAAAIPLIAQPLARAGLNSGMGQALIAPPSSIINSQTAAGLGLLSGAYGQNR